MTKYDLYDRISIHKSSFTKVEYKIASYIEKNPQKVLYMSITDLAAACDVGDTSVFRFCKTMKFKGYQEFKMFLAQSTDVSDEFDDDNGEKTDEDSIVKTSSKKILDNEISVLNETASLLKTDDIEKTVEMMKNSKRICFFGVGSSLITALDAKNKFMRIMPNVECSVDTHFQAMQASLLGPEDLAIIISYSGSTKDIIEIAKICKQNNVKIVCITRFSKSPLTAFTDITLLCGAKESPLQGGSFTSKISQLYIMDILYNQYIKGTKEISQQNREKTAAAILEKMY